MEKELHIQSLLRKHGLDYVQDLLKLEVKHRDDLILLKYNQIEADWNQIATRECRGLILDKVNNWDVVAFPYIKFFNHGEGHADSIDWENSWVYEKSDGSLLTLWHYNGDWRTSTTGTIYADSLANNGEHTFNDLFWNAIKNMYGSKEEFVSKIDTNFNYMFELCTPWNIVVTQHSESKAFLHGVRDMRTWKELDIDSIDLIKVKRYPFSDLDTIMKTFNGMSWQEEGYVICDPNFKRVKIKNPAYIEVHHLKSGGSPYEIVGVIKNNEIDEFLTYFKEKEAELMTLKSSWDILEDKLQTLWDKLSTDETLDTQKKYALEVLNKIEKPFHGTFFNLRNKKISSVREGLNLLDNKMLYNYLLK